jgi:nucleotide-binding universal stress UspA family protein
VPEGAIAAFKRAVLGLNGGPTDALVVKLGCQLAKPLKAELVALHIVEVDWSHDLEEDIASDNVLASTVLDQAERIGEKMGVPVRTELLQARDVGAALVDEAAELDGDLIVLGLPVPQEVRRRLRDGSDGAVRAPERRVAGDRGPRADRCARRITGRDDVGGTASGDRGAMTRAAAQRGVASRCE